MTAPGEHGGRTADEVWSPWMPEVGQRVRVLPRPECYYCRSAEDEDGLIGVVEHVGDRNYRWRSEAREPGESAHIYWVEFAEEIGSSGTFHSHFAASELVPVPRDGRDISTDAAGEEVRS